MRLLKVNGIYLLLLFPLILGFIIRYVGLSEIGIQLSDAFFYWETAWEWTHGKVTLTEHFRPFIYWLYGVWMSMTGPTEPSIRYLNATMDCGVAFGLIYAGWMLRRNWILGIAAAICYLFLFEPLFHARSETVHSPSTLFVLLSTLCLLRWTQVMKSVWIFLCGLFLNMAWLTHPDLAVLGAPIFLSMSYKFLKSSEVTSENYWKKFLSQFLIFLLGYFLIFLIFIAVFDFNEIMANFLGNHKAQTKSIKDSYFWRLSFYSFNYITHNMGYTLFAIFMASLIAVGLKLKRGIMSSQDFILAAFPVGYLILCALLFARIPIPRLFLPLVPIALLLSCIQIFDLLPRPTWMLGILALVISIIHFPTAQFALKQGPSMFKRLDEKYSPYLNENSRLLISPMSIYHIHSPLSNHMYLKGKGLYLHSTKQRSLDEVVAANEVTHVWISDVIHDKRVFGKNLKFTYEERLATLFKMKPKGYTIEAETQAMREFLISKNAKLIDKSDFGELYEFAR